MEERRLQLGLFIDMMKLELWIKCVVGSKLPNWCEVGRSNLQWGSIHHQLQLVTALLKSPSD